MPLAPFISKDALAASQVLRDINRDAFERVLLDTPVRVAFGADADSVEGRACLDLAVRLFARLYPTLIVLDVSGKLGALVTELQTVARSIHPDIDLPDDADDAVTLVIGSASLLRAPRRTVYVGSNGWTASVCPDRSRPLGATSNPYGPGAAACLGVAAVFRLVFADWLPDSGPVEGQTMSVLHPWANGPAGDETDVPAVDLGETHLVGLGAIGNGALWALARTPGLSGRLHLVDGERVDATNLQRYVLTTHDDGDKETLKAELAAHALAGSGVDAVPHALHWDRYLEARQDWHLDRVAVCVDTGRDRMAVQASLPRVILNASTGRGDLGVTRHIDFLNSPSLCCLYFPHKEETPLPQRIADDIGLSHRENVIRDHLQRRIPVGLQLLAEIAAALGTDPSRLEKYVGHEIDVFHSALTCGGDLLRLNGSPASHGVEAPLAFQSALAGILLAAEVVADCAGLRAPADPVETRTDILGRPGWFVSDMGDPVPKGMGGRCLCEDDDFRRQYASKYGHVGAVAPT